MKRGVAGAVGIAQRLIQRGTALLVGQSLRMHQRKVEEGAQFTVDGQVVAAGDGGTYDFGFIDADKTGYDAYYERGLALLRPGGIMLFDNVLWGGDVADPSENDADTKALRELAQKAKADARVHSAMTSIGDGLLFCVKK